MSAKIVKTKLRVDNDCATGIRHFGVTSPINREWRIRGLRRNIQLVLKTQPWFLNLTVIPVGSTPTKAPPSSPTRLFSHSSFPLHSLSSYSSVCLLYYPPPSPPPLPPDSPPSPQSLLLILSPPPLFPFPLSLLPPPPPPLLNESAKWSSKVRAPEVTTTTTTTTSFIDECQFNRLTCEWCWARPASPESLGLLLEW